MPNSADITIRAIESPSDPAIAAFGRLQTAVYYDSGSLIPGQYIPRMLASKSRSRRNLLIVAEMDDEVVGGTFFHYLAEAGSAFSSFMGILPVCRGRGLARRLHEARFALLDDVTHSPVPGIFIDVVAPERVSKAELDAERRFGFEPDQRRKVFRALGFRKVDIAYRQPVGGPHGGPLETLDLLFFPRQTGTQTIPIELVSETMRAYWRGWLGDERTNREVQRLRSLAGDEVPLL